MRNKASLICFILIFFVVSGCGYNRPNDVEKVEYHRGTEGIKLNILSNMPENEVMERSGFNVVLEVNNKGAYDSDNVVVKVTNLLKEYVEIEQDETRFTLKGRSFEYPKGETEYVNFNLKSLKIPRELNELRVPFRVVLNYDYQTEATAEVCVGYDIFDYNKNIDKVCEPGSISMPSGQGAPVSVTKIEQVISPYNEFENRYDFRISLANRGSGDVNGEISIEDVILGSNYLTCSSQSINLKDKDSFNCMVIKEKSVGEYLTPLKVRLRYKYSEYEDKKVIIKRA